MADRVVGPADLRDTRTLSEIAQDVLRDIQDVFRSEMRLAGAEMAEKARKAAKAGGLLGGAAFCAILAAACLVTTGIAALALAMPVWLAALLMCIFLACIGGACYAGGRAKLRRLDMKPQQTIETIKEDVEWAKQRTS